MAKPCNYDSRPAFDQIIEPLRDVAKRLGYAIAVHGTLKRDIDLVAVPWSRSAVAAKTLAKAIQHKTREIIGYAEPHPMERQKYFRDGLAGFAKGHGRMTAKPHGRRSWTFHLLPTHDGPYIDLSVMPRIPES